MIRSIVPRKVFQVSKTIYLSWDSSDSFPRRQCVPAIKFLKGAPAEIGFGKQIPEP